MKITYSPTITVSKTAQEWKLLGEGPDADKAAKVLSDAAADALMKVWAQMISDTTITPCEAYHLAIDLWLETAGKYSRSFDACATESRAEMQDLAWHFLSEFPAPTLELLRAGRTVEQIIPA